MTGRVDSAVQLGVDGPVMSNRWPSPSLTGPDTLSRTRVQRDPPPLSWWTRRSDVPVTD